MNQTFKTFLKNNWLPLLLILLAVGLELFLVARSFNFLLTNILPDDAFYYFQVAREVVAGHGSTFDGTNLTNGYHPLWLLFLLPLFKFLPANGGSLAPLYATLGLEIILNSLTALLLLALLNRLTSNFWLKSLGLFLWLFNPFVIYENLNGLETSLSLFLITLLLFLSFKYQELVEDNYWPGIFLGVVGGLMMLARLDNVFYFLALLSWLWARGRKLQPPRVVWLVGLTATFVVLPWLLWNYLTFHMFLTSSAVTNVAVSHNLIVQDHGSSWIQTVKAALYSTDYQWRYVLLATGAPWFWFIFLGCVLTYWFLIKKGGYRSCLTWSPLLFLFGGFWLDFLINAAWRWTARTWYFVPFNLFLALLVVYFFSSIPNEKIKFKREAAVILVFFLSFSFAVSWSKNLRDRFSAQQEMLAASLWANQNLPLDQTIGAFNAGVQAYFSHHKLVNLDGLINNTASRALLSHNLWSYLLKEKITYLSDYDIYWQYRYRSFLGTSDLGSHLKKVKNISLVKSNRSQTGLNIYKIVE